MIYVLRLSNFKIQRGARTYQTANSTQRKKGPTKHNTFFLFPVNFRRKTRRFVDPFL